MSTALDGTLGWNKGQGHIVITKRKSKETAWKERSRDVVEHWKELSEVQSDG
jgi:hypothetical protein